MGIKMVCPLRRGDVMGFVAIKEFVQGKLTVSSTKVTLQDFNTYESSPGIRGDLSDGQAQKIS